jgi:hypothetical protein
VFDLLAVCDAEFLCKFRVDRYTLQCDAPTGTMLHDPTNYRGSLLDSWFMRAIGIGLGLNSTTLQIASISCSVLAIGVPCPIRCKS